MPSVVIDLSRLTSAQGFIIQGDEASDIAGWSVSTAGDINGDGIDDVIVGAPGGDDSIPNAGEAYVIYGQTGSSRDTVDLTGLAANDGFVIQGDFRTDRAGYSVSAAGDVNRDGIADLIVGASGGDDGGSDAGEAYVIYGQTGNSRGTMDLNGLAAGDGFIIQGDAIIDRAGSSVSSAGDVNGDGIDDVIVGAPHGDDGGVSAGEAYVIYGQTGSSRATVDLTGLAASDGFIIQGDTVSEFVGFSVSSAGDVNGDGIADVIVGAPGGADGGRNAGEAYVIYGQTGSSRGTVDLTDLDASDGFIIQGDAEYDRAGWSVSAAGDVNGDGIDDVIVASRDGDDGGPDAGEAYVIYGQTGSSRVTVDLTGLLANDGFIIQRDAGSPGGTHGVSVSAAGDVNGDGIDDMIVGASDTDRFAGEAYVIYGQTGSSRATVDLTGLAASDGFIIQADEARGGVGWSVSAAGDVNGDGIDDVIIGAPFRDDGGTNAGEAYVIYGFRDTPSTNPPTATATGPNLVAPGASVPLDGITNANGLFTWSDPDGLADVLEFSVVDQSVGGGFLTLDGDPVVQAEGTTITNIPMSEIGRWAFVSGADGEFDNIGFAVTDSSGNTSDATVAFVESDDAPPPPAEGPSQAELEYFARVTAYLEYTQNPTSGEWIAQDTTEDVFAKTGYRVSDVFKLGEFQAVALEGVGKEPVLAIRGTDGNIIDWRFNFNSSIAPGYNDFEAAWQLNTADSLRAWVLSQSSFALTGHSQGGSQAQLLAAYATDRGVPLSSVATFNSPGISSSFITAFYEPALVASVTHYSSAGDVVELVGEEYLPGTIIRYDITTANYGGSLREYVGGFVGDTHTNHWANREIYGSPLDDGRPLFSLGPIQPEPLTALQYSDATFSHAELTDAAGDPEFIGFLAFIANIDDFIYAPLRPLVPVLPSDEIGPFIAKGLSDRGSAEELRPYLAELFFFLEDLPPFLVDAVTTAFSAAGAAFSWTKDAVLAFRDWTIDTWIGVSNFTAEVWNFTTSLPDKFWQAVSSWTSEKWDQVSQWSEEVWSKLSSFSVEVWQATIDGTAEVLKKIGDFTDQMARLGADAWNAMAEWTEDQWNAVADWTEETWDKAKDFSADVWENTKGAVAGFFGNLKDGAATVVNATVDKYNRTVDRLDDIGENVADEIDDFWDTVRGFSYFRDNPDPVVIEANSGTATAASTAPAILVGSNNETSDVLTGRSGNVLFLPSSGDIIRQDGDNPQSLNLRTLAESSTTNSLLDTGEDYIVGRAADLDGIEVFGFGNDDAIFVSGTNFAQDALTVTGGSAILGIDIDGDSMADTTIRLAGNYELDKFVVEAGEVGTFITYVGSLVLPDPVDPPVITAAGGGGTTLQGAGGNDVLSAAAGANTINGGGGNDVLAGGLDNDSLSGGSGNDILIGDNSDFISGADTLNGGTGDDLLEGGGGADTFVFIPGDGADTIGDIALDYGDLTNSTVSGPDFVSGVDTVALTGFGLTDGAAALALVTDVGGVATFSDQGTTITFAGLTAADLAANDFQIL